VKKKKMKDNRARCCVVDDEEKMGMQRGSDGEGLQGFARVAALHDSRSSARRDGKGEDTTTQPQRQNREIDL
jgi:hypothetical protein